MIDVTLYTDPACPFAFSAEPARLRLRWHYGDGLLRALRARTMSGGLLDDPQLIAAAARDAGLDPDQLATAQASTCLPGFTPVEAYEAAIANLDPELTRRPPPTHTGPFGASPNRLAG